MNINEYYETVRNDIAKEFGLEAGGYAPAPRYALPITIAQRINAKYPSEFSVSRFDRKLNPNAVYIAQRYISLVMKGGN